MQNNLAPIVLVCLMSTAFVGQAAAEDGCCCCAQCGCQQPCQKTCRLVTEEKKVEIFCWGCKCEDFCVPCRSERGCKNCDTVCETCGDKASEGICVEPKRHVWYDWIPGCGAQIYTRHKLMRGSTIVKVPSFKWVVEDLCPECTAKCEAAQFAPGVDIPPPPLVAENVRTIFPAPSATMIR